MALIDLYNLDLLDAVLAHHFNDEFKEKMLSTYMQTYAQILGEALSTELKPEDDEAMKKLLASPDVTPEKVDQFYKDRIPHFEAKVVLLALEFKKRFLLSVYKNKLEEYKKSKSNEGLAAWEQIYKDAEADNWNEVGRLLKIVDSMHSSAKKQSSVQK
ncbi:hypothetical protein HYW54_02380 [Candidatus Gottesmanbacteria bacterium]|nr:hypothetical protein [Candidatus Gottesmanbacteria bacterium]